MKLCDWPTKLLSSLFLEHIFRHYNSPPIPIFCFIFSLLPFPIYMNHISYILKEEREKGMILFPNTVLSIAKQVSYDTCLDKRQSKNCFQYLLVWTLEVWYTTHIHIFSPTNLINPSHQNPHQLLIFWSTNNPIYYFIKS